MVSDEIARAHEHEQMRKIFVGGLNWETSDENLKKYFSQYGNIVDCVVMRDSSGKSRGFGFVTFDKVSCVDDCIAGKPHRLDERDIEPKRAVPKDEASNPAALARTRKIFVGGLASSTTEEDIKTYFTGLCNNFNRGNVLEVELKRDRNTDRIRGFAFVTFDDEDVVEKIVSMKYHEIKLKECEVKKAESRAAMQRRREQDDKPSGAVSSSGKGSTGGQNSHQGFNPVNMGGWGGAGFPFFGPGGFWGGPGQGSGGGGGSNEGQGHSGGGNRGNNQSGGNSGGNQSGNMGSFGPMGPFGPGFGFPGFGFPGFGPGFGFYGMPFGWGGQGYNQDGSSDNKGGGSNNDRGDGRGSNSGYSGNSGGSNQGSYNAGNTSDYANSSGGNFGRMTPADYMSMAANMGNFGGTMGGSTGGSGSTGGANANMSGANAMASMANMGFNNPWGGYPFNFNNFTGGTDDTKNSGSGNSGFGDYQMGTYNQGSSNYGPTRGSSSLKKSDDTKRAAYQPY